MVRDPSARHQGIARSLSELRGRIETDRAGGRTVAEFDAVWAKAVGAKLSSVDTINISPGAVYPCSSVGSEFAAICRGEFVRLHGKASYTPKSSQPSSARTAPSARVAPVQLHGRIPASNARDRAPPSVVVLVLTVGQEPQ